MGKLTEDEKALIARTEKTFRKKLTKEEIIGILGRNPYAKQKVGRPLAQKKVKGTQTEIEEKQRQRKQKRENKKDVPLNLQRLFAEGDSLVRRERRRRREANQKNEPEPEDIAVLHGTFREWEIDLIDVRMSERYPTSEWRNYRIRIAEGHMSPEVIRLAILDMIRLASTRNGPNGEYQMLPTTRIQIMPSHPEIGRYHTRWRITTLAEAYDTFTEMISAVLESNQDIDIQNITFEILVIEAPFGGVKGARGNK